MNAFDDAWEKAAPILFSTMGEPLEWDGIPIAEAVVEDLEDLRFEVDSGVNRLRKRITVRAADLADPPDPGDEVLLLAAWSVADEGDYWTVEKVLFAQGMYDVTVFRFV